MVNSEEKERVRKWIDSYRPGYSLPRDFYVSDLVFQEDIERVWRRGWLFVGFTCQISNLGDFMTLRLGDDSIIVVRRGENEFAAFHNLCRHRGALLCDQPNGRVKRFVCPYHQWTYDLAGELVACRGMQSDIDKSDLGLVRIALRELAGMIFVCLEDVAPPFDDADRLVRPLAEPQGFERAKIAKIIDYEVNANWKVVLGEQSRMLSLQCQSSGIHQSQF